MRTNGRVLLVVRSIGGTTSDAYVQSMLKNGYRVQEISRGQLSLPVMEQDAPLVACFQYDYPDLPGLAELRLVKERLPSVPLIMITQAHSEALAVWAFRTGVRDYFVQPVDIDRFLSVLRELSQIRAAPESRRRFLPRDAQAPPNLFPPEARLRPRTAAPVLAELDAAISYVARNLDGKIMQTDVAKICGLSPFQFSRLFKRRYEMTFQEYVQRMRIAEARRMLEHPGASVTDVCFNVGFHDLSYFTRTFQRYVGEAPSHYRQKAARQQQSGNSTPRTGPEEPRVRSEGEALTLSAGRRDAEAGPRSAR